MEFLWISFTDQKTGNLVTLPISAIKTIEATEAGYVVNIGPAWKEYQLTELQYRRLVSMVQDLHNIRFGLHALDMNAERGERC